LAEEWEQPRRLNYSHAHHSLADFDLGTDADSPENDEEPVSILNPLPVNRLQILSHRQPIRFCFLPFIFAFANNWCSSPCGDDPKARPDFSLPKAGK